jgi:hypothetical protein
MKIDPKQSKLLAQLSVYGRFDNATVETDNQPSQKYYRIVKMESIDIMEMIPTGNCYMTKVLFLPFIISFLLFLFTSVLFSYNIDNSLVNFFSCLVT